MKKISLYLDTSVIGGYFDFEFENPTRKLFQLMQMGVYDIYLSQLTMSELEKAPPRLYDKFVRLLSDIEFTLIQESKESLELADQFIQSGVLPRKFRDDARHVALAVCYKADYVLSWNFKHLANIDRIRKFNSVNIQWGYSFIDIRTPLEVIGYDPGAI